MIYSAGVLYLVPNEGAPIAKRRGSVPMPVLVTPERTVYRLADKAALASYVDTRTAAGHRVDYQLKANLAQLLGFDSVGKDRTKRWEAVDGARGKFYNLSDVSNVALLSFALVDSI